jgi:hypothetical protein
MDEQESSASSLLIVAIGALLVLILAGVGLVAMKFLRASGPPHVDERAEIARIAREEEVRQRGLEAAAKARKLLVGTWSAKISDGRQIILELGDDDIYQ